MDKSVDWPGALDPPWTDAGADSGHGGVLTEARRRGCNRERSARGTRLGPHRGSSGVEEDERRRCRVGRRRRSVRELLRRGEREM
jgi:hypothetical protein